MVRLPCGSDAHSDSPVGTAALLCTGRGLPVAFTEPVVLLTKYPPVWILRKGQGLRSVLTMGRGIVTPKQLDRIGQCISCRKSEQGNIPITCPSDDLILNEPDMTSDHQVELRHCPHCGLPEDQRDKFCTSCDHLKGAPSNVKAATVGRRDVLRKT